MRLLPFAPRALAICAIALGALVTVPCHQARAQEVEPPAAESEPVPSEPAPVPALPGEPPVRRTGEVAITAARAERPVLDVPGNVTVIDREAIDESGARDVPELLRREAGIFVTNTTSSPEGYMVEGRGFNNGGGNGSSLLVLVDGRRVNEADSSQIDWSLIHLDYVERIEVARGPVSSLYGDNAMSGVIQIFTRRREGAPEFILRGRRASYDTTQGSLFAGGSAGPIAATLYADGYDADDYRERSDYGDHSFAGSLRWTPTDAASFEVSSGHSSDDRKRPGALTHPEIDELGRDAASPGTDRNQDDVRVHFVQGQSQVVLAEHVTWTTLPYYRSRSNQARVAFPVSGGQDLFDLDQDTSSWGGISQVEVDVPVLGRGNRVIAGVEFLREDVDRESAFESGAFGNSSADGDFHRRIWSGFLQEELDLLDDLLLTAGLRYDRARYRGENVNDSAFGTSVDDLSEVFDKWSPRVALVYRVIEPTSVYASYSRGFRFPNFDEAVGFTGALFDLGPQDSNGYEVGVKHRSPTFAANLAFYWMTVNDEILFNHEIDQFGFASPQNANIDRTRHRGIESWFSWHPRPWVELYGSYTFDDSQIVRDRSSNIANLDGDQIPITPRNRGTLGTLFRLPYAFELGANMNVVGERYFANDLSNELGKFDGYTTVDLSAAWRPRLNEHLAFGVVIRMLNAFDHTYSEFAGERSFERDVIGYDPSPDRNYELGLEVTWRP